MNYAELIICTVWHENYTWNLIYSFMVSDKTVKLKYVNYACIWKSTVYHYDIKKETGLP